VVREGVIGSARSISGATDVRGRPQQKLCRRIRAEGKLLRPAAARAYSARTMSMKPRALLLITILLPGLPGASTA
jgi:hypothetical protein